MRKPFSALLLGLACQAVFAAPWNAGAAYQAGQQVRWQGQDWQAKWRTRAETPAANPRGSWTPVAAAKAAAQAEPGQPQPPTLQQALQYEAALTDTAFFRNVKASIRTLPNAQVEQVAPGSAANPLNVRRVERLLPAAKWEYYFSRRDASYSYQRFLQAIAKFPAICDDYSDGRDGDAICRHSLATMFAHFAQETGDHNRSDTVPEWRQGLKYLREMGCDETGPGCGYNTECADPVFNKVWTCGKNADGSWKKYFGRGAKQLSYNYNYGPFSQAMYNGDQSVLLKNPDLVASTWLNLTSATFFFVFPQPPKPSMLHVLDGTWVPNAADKAAGAGNNFATTIQIINAECGGGTERQAAQNRIDYYRQFAKDLGWDYGNEQLSCANMQRFSAASSAAYNIYWEKDWKWGNDYKCQLVNYQTPYSALQAGNYQRCVEDNWNVKLK
ncbi:chitinase [Chromobacterium haemolyticum]|uniref:Chitinase n=1 Tax=Chromobacterium haemolyticum TaxID=394935 RepID=A0ABS3GKT6_9NEIS|nr:glycoside hydrolase family 19 protein [Chromobacterium haemolyticum]MBK0413950.1 chitinase [Chromobacterium haemolyticum]MBO0415363.1 chitinase [Chromobacterium haemolyticum]MBO0498624.1 chitinase [Chromobacterium haemolyticum]MDH0340694.1 chitinase [Chromobacterium haemolyticum]